MNKRISPWALTIALVLAATGCAVTDEPVEEPAEEEMAAEPVPLDRGVLAAEGRPEADVAQDADRHAIDLYEYFEIQPAMTVGDFWPGGGYNTALLSALMGEEGHVYGVLDFFTDFRDGAFADGYRTRVEESGLTNVTIVEQFTDLPAESLDAAVAIRNYHDVIGFERDHEPVVAAIYAAMKPGAVVGIVEVATSNEGWHAETHRLNQQVVIDHFTAGGFEFEGSSDMLHNPDDDHSTQGFQEGRHTMDRYVLKFRKPGMDETTD